MPKVKVWNDNKLKHSEMFKDELIEIPPGGYILMESDEAVNFRGQFHPIKLGGDDQPLPESFKMIRLTPHDSTEVETKPVDQHVCLVCKYKAPSEKDLISHCSKEHADRLIVDEEAEAELKKKKKAS